MRALGQWVWVVAVALGAAGCAAGLSPAGQKVKVVDEAPVDCKRLGAVSATAQGGHGEQVKVDAATIELRNRTGEMGGDLVHLEEQDEQGQQMKLSGVAYQCAGAK
ncbi:MAG: DUF4156 domain-containing protein [Deltaproteobacteria bacterium]|jgi:hypothetical protein|nr:DUF4156 domain-containing protein [Deltaproteobacteria bacterium]MBW2534822.1 DUF4156 domain-containing protein [Deltaproteobacteria bacterium]